MKLDSTMYTDQQTNIFTKRINRITYIIAKVDETIIIQFLTGNHAGILN